MLQIRCHNRSFKASKLRRLDPALAGQSIDKEHSSRNYTLSKVALICSTVAQHRGWLLLSLKLRCIHAFWASCHASRHTFTKDVLVLFMFVWLYLAPFMPLCCSSFWSGHSLQKLFLMNCIGRFSRAGDCPLLDLSVPHLPFLWLFFWEGPPLGL